MAKTEEAPKVAFDIACPGCQCDAFVPLVKMRAIKSYGGDRLQIEWPSREGADDYSRVGCPQCGTILSVQGNGTVADTGYKLFSKNGAPEKKPKAKARK